MQVASGGRIVLLSFHQPSPAMFSLLDAAYLMARGRCIFAGPPAAADAWFAAHGLPCPVGTAIAEHMLDAVSDPGSLQRLLAAHDGEQPAAAADAAAGQGGLHRHTPSAAATDGGKTGRSDGDSSFAKLEAPISNGGSGNGDASAAAETGEALRAKGSAAGAAAPLWRPSLSRELAVVFWRTLVDIVRNPALLLLHWCAHCWGLVGLLMRACSVGLPAPPAAPPCMAVHCRRCAPGALRLCVVNTRQLCVTAPRGLMLGATTSPAHPPPQPYPTPRTTVVTTPPLLPASLCRILALLMGAFVGAVFFNVSFDVSGAQNRVGEDRGASRHSSLMRCCMLRRRGPTLT